MCEKSEAFNVNFDSPGNVYLYKQQTNKKQDSLNKKNSNHSSSTKKPVRIPAR